MARDYPANERELARVSGMSERKLQEFGRVFLAVIAGHLETQPRQMFAATSFEEPAAQPARAQRGRGRRMTAHTTRSCSSGCGRCAASWRKARGLPAYCILHDSALAPDGARLPGE